MLLPKTMKIAVEDAIKQPHGHSMLLTVKYVDNVIPVRFIDRLLVALMFQDAKISCRRDRLPKRATKASVGDY